VYPKVSGLTTWSENRKWYSSLPLGAIVSLFCESVFQFCCHNTLCCFSMSAIIIIIIIISSTQSGNFWIHPRTYIHIYIHTYIHTHTYIHKHIHTYVMKCTDSNTGTFVFPESGSRIHFMKQDQAIFDVVVCCSVRNVPDVTDFCEIIRKTVKL
jgi:hypothetical protein